MSNERNHASSEEIESLTMSLEEALEDIRNAPILRYRRVPMEVERFPVMVNLDARAWLFFDDAKAKAKDKGMDVSNFDLGTFLFGVLESWMAGRGIFAGILKATRLEDEVEEETPLLEEGITNEFER